MPTSSLLKIHSAASVRTLLDLGSLYLRRQNTTFSTKSRLMSPDENIELTATGLQSLMHEQRRKGTWIIKSTAITFTPGVWNTAHGHRDALLSATLKFSFLRVMFVSVLCKAPFLHMEISLKRCDISLPTAKNVLRTDSRNKSSGGFWY